MTDKAKTLNYWSLGLLKDMNNPEFILEEDKYIVVIKDKYPKARFHYLVLSKKDIPSISKATKEDLQLLHHMEIIGKKYAQRHKLYEFQIGYHAIPHMCRLHLHVISTDFDSPCLKTRIHWNLFNTSYFIPSEDVRKEIEKNGQILFNRQEKKELFNQPIKCHKCSYMPKGVPDLKRHILRHIP